VVCVLLNVILVVNSMRDKPILQLVCSSCCRQRVNDDSVVTSRHVADNWTMMLQRGASRDRQQHDVVSRPLPFNRRRTISIR